MLGQDILKNSLCFASSLILFRTLQVLTPPPLPVPVQPRLRWQRVNPVHEGRRTLEASSSNQIGVGTGWPFAVSLQTNEHSLGSDYLYSDRCKPVCHGTTGCGAFASNQLSAFEGQTAKDGETGPSCGGKDERLLQAGNSRS